MMWATRFWWMLRSLGFDGAAVLDGGFDKWKAEGRPTESDRPGVIRLPRSRPRRARASSSTSARCWPRPESPHRDRQRARPQFHKGLEPSRYGRPGRVPGSVNVPAATLVNPDAKDFTSLSDAEAKFRARGVSGDKRVICYCGGGISATIDLFLLHSARPRHPYALRRFHGEWARDPTLPIETD